MYHFWTIWGICIYGFTILQFWLFDSFIGDLVVKTIFTIVVQYFSGFAAEEQYW